MAYGLKACSCHPLNPIFIPKKTKTKNKQTNKQTNKKTNKKTKTNKQKMIIFTNKTFFTSK